ncbi:MAG: THUMP domain-containing class I SAM-dependent RNA methyltransferase [Eubacteriaceae bacterium]|jgi:putative N6-adenine-specific DNA methylase
MKNEFQLIATAAFGLESLVKRELTDLGYTIESTENGRVYFSGGPEAIIETNLWLRCADRVLLKVGEFKAETFDELYEKTKALPWQKFIPAKAAFPAAKITSVKSKLFSKSDGQRIVKKAVADKLMAAYKTRVLPETGPGFPIQIRILKDMVTLSIDTSGSGLHKRGYRQYGNEAPIKETIAAALVMLSRWNPSRPFLDPMCGSGTIVIEAAMIGKNMAPGLQKQFISETWPMFYPGQWEQARRNAKAAENDLSFRVIGSDIDARSLKQARTNAEKAGVTDYVAFQRIDLKNIVTKKKYGVIVTNPPYGERIGEVKTLRPLYVEMGKVFRSLDDWSYFIITAYPDFQKVFGEKATRNRKIYNSTIKTYFYEYFGPLPPRRKPRPQTDAVPEGDLPESGAPEKEAVTGTGKQDNGQ